MGVYIGRLAHFYAGAIHDEQGIVESIWPEITW
jgi:hypothetical protein